MSKLVLIVNINLWQRALIADFDFHCCTNIYRFTAYGVGINIFQPHCVELTCEREI